MARRRRTLQPPRRPLSFHIRSSSRSRSLFVTRVILFPSKMSSKLYFSGGSRLQLSLASSVQRRQRHTSAGPAPAGIRSTRLNLHLLLTAPPRLESPLRLSPSMPPQDQHQASASDVCKSGVRGAPQLTRVLDLVFCRLFPLCSLYVSSITTVAGLPTPLAPPLSTTPQCRKSQLMVKVSLFTSQSKNRVVVRDTIIVCMVLNCLTRFVKMLGGFTDVYDWNALPYIYFMKKLLVGSPSHVPCSISFPFLISMKGEDCSASTSGRCSSFYTVLLSCVAVCTGPEDASESTSVYLVGENWVSTSLVTNLQLSDLVAKLLSTHSSFALNLLSSSHEDLSIVVSFAYVVYAYNQRGCLFPSIEVVRLYGCTVVPKTIEV
ncbi:hypothetical protein HA466_0193830 [Hirschfeldia incana]|nr:hypothetical protein HA466_0288740 [Hirschfeldia incana]KAJ0243307.1 hypothetical protein HA466_0193830 [Hirschfeldia incana]